MADLYLGLGSNQGKRETLMNQALLLLEERIGTIVCLSAFYETPPWGFVSPNPFLNAAVKIQTNLLPQTILCITQQIEIKLGRQKKSKPNTYTDRPIDLDLLLYNDWVIETECFIEHNKESMHLSLPHPLMHKRLFVIEPLAEIAPQLVHPTLNKSMYTLYQELKKNSI